MCKADPPRRQSSRLLLSLDSFHSKDGNPPGMLSFCSTGVVVIAFLVTVEMLLRLVFTHFQEYHHILQNETNRQILARHVGVDALSCAIVAVWGFYSWKICVNALYAPPASYDQRLFTYHPNAFRITLFFFFYQIKNLYDAIVWGDGPEYIFHHVFSLVTAWGAMYPGAANCYAIFFFGLSEISTAVLCLLANFDDDHGVPGLGAAWPAGKVVLGGAFVVMFVLCRCIFWPMFSYIFIRDIRQAFLINCERTQKRRSWFVWFMISLSGLSVLQIAWLGQIVIVAKKELQQMGML